MSKQTNTLLIAGGILSTIAAFIHYATIIGGPDWYRFFGAGERMAELAAEEHWYPVVVTLFIGTVLMIWAAYAFAGAGLMRRLPFMRFCLCGISAVYLLRGLGGLVMVVFMENPYMTDARGQATFMIVSSGIVLVYGLAYALGTIQAWRTLSPTQ